MKSTKQEDTLVVVRHIKEQTKDGKWIALTIKDVAAITGKSTTHSYGILKDLPNHEELESENFGTESKALYKFRAKDRTPVELKHHPKFKDLYIHEHDKIVKITTEKKYDAACIDSIVKIMNVLAQLGARQDFVSNIPKITDLLLMNSAQVRLYFDIIAKVGLGELKNANSIRIFPGENPVPVAKEVEQPVEGQRKTIIETVPASSFTEPQITHFEKSSKPVAEVKPVTAPVVEVEPEKNAVLLGMLNSNVKDFIGFLGDFKGFFEDKLSQIDSLGGDPKKVAELERSVSEKDDEIEKLKIQLNSGNETLQKCLEESKKLREAMFEKNTELKKMKMFHETEKERNDQIFMFIQERMQIAIAEITNTISEFMQLPDWKVNPGVRAATQNKIIGAITAASQDMVNYNDNKRIED